MMKTVYCAVDLHQLYEEERIRQLVEVMEEQLGRDKANAVLTRLEIERQNMMRNNK